MFLSFLLIIGASVYAGNYFTLIALIPMLIFNFASKKGSRMVNRMGKTRCKSPAVTI
jgi:1,4-dihydroxy-2-naphthoate octaprenyltransferase